MGGRKFGIPKARGVEHFVISEAKGGLDEDAAVVEYEYFLESPISQSQQALHIN